MKKIGTILLMTSMILTTMPVNALTKDETVYSKLNNDGSVKNTVVSEYLKNTEETINDKTDLKDVLNLNGTEKYTIDGSNIIWDAKGKDIYYQGKTDKELPVSLNIVYKLNGKEMKLDEILGQKGRVEITLNYANKDSHSVLVNGSYQKLYTPFIVTFGTIIKNENNSNITVSNGRVVSNGKSSVVVAVASPGLHESLGIDAVKDFDSITLSYDTNSFELSSMYSVVTSGLIKQDDLKVFNKLDSLYTSMSTLSNSSKQLKEGSEKLYNGTLQLQDGLNKSINSSSKTLSEAQQNTILNSTLETLSAKFTDEYKNAIGLQAVQTLNATSEMSARITALQTAGSAVVISGTNTDLDGTTFDQLATICTSGNIPDALNTACTGHSADITEYLTNKGLIEKMQQIAYSTAVSTAEQTAIATTKELVPTLSEKVATEAKNNTLKTINTNVATLVEGTKALSDGISKFDSEGISKLASLVNGDVKTVEEKVKALIKLGDTYDSFTMKDDSAEGETKFVLMVDAQKKVVKTETKNTSKKKKDNLLDKIKKIF